MLDLNFGQNNSWKPQLINPSQLVANHISELGNDVLERQDAIEWLIIFQTEPFIDSLYVKIFPSDQNFILDERRFVFKEGYSWEYDKELFFSKKCINNPDCYYSFGALDDIFKIYSKNHTEWHLQRYYTKNLRLLDHIYHCMKQNTAKEMLYKAGLDELAAKVDDLDEMNLLAIKPSELYDGLSVRTLRSLNCEDGAYLLAKHDYREYLKDLQSKFPDTFQERLNDAQCRYIRRLIDGDLTVGETGRLFRARRKDLAKIWNYSQYELFLIVQIQQDELRDTIEGLEKVDPLYHKFFSVTETDPADQKLKLLRYYLLVRREDFDKNVRRANRKRSYDWQERDHGYVVRYPQTINDFCREAIYMGNCLLTYVDAFLNNDTTILLMRREDAVNDPFITIEIYHGRLIQAYHRFNKDCTPEEADWIRAYCRRHGISCGRFQFDVHEDLGALF